MSLAHLQLESYRLSSLTIRFNDEWLEAGEDAAADEHYLLAPDVDMSEIGEDGRYLVKLTVQCEPAPEVEGVCRFDRIEATVWGIFALSEDTPEDQRGSLIAWNTVTILHGIIRGLIISATGGCVGGPFLLPAVNYVEYMKHQLVREEDEDEAHEADPASDGQD